MSISPVISPVAPSYLATAAQHETKENGISTRNIDVGSIQAQIIHLPSAVEPSSATLNQEDPELNRKLEELAKKAAAQVNIAFGRDVGEPISVEIAACADGSLQVVEANLMFTFPDDQAVDRYIDMEHLMEKIMRVHTENDPFYSSESFKKAEKIYKKAIEKALSQGNDIP